MRASSAKAAEEAIAAFRASYPTQLRFPYRFRAHEKPFFVSAIYHDGQFTYIHAQTSELPSLYELRDDAPNLVSFQVEHGDLHRPEGARARVPRDREAAVLLCAADGAVRRPMAPEPTRPDEAVEPARRRRPARARAIHDRRRVPRGALPRQAQTWIMLGLALPDSGRDPADRDSPSRARRSRRPQPAAPARPRSSRSASAAIRTASDRAGSAAPRGAGAPCRSTPLVTRRRRRSRRRRRRSASSTNGADATSRVSLPTTSPSVVAASGTPPAATAPSPTRHAALAVSRVVPCRCPHRRPPPPTPRRQRAHAASTSRRAPSPRRRRRRRHRPSASAAGRSPESGPPHTLLEGTVIETVLVNRLDGTFQGPVQCLVTTPVYSQDRQAVVIPAGARVLGIGRARPGVGRHAARGAVSPTRHARWPHRTASTRSRA